MGVTEETEGDWLIWGPEIINPPLKVWLRGSILFPVQEANHAELMEHEASLSRNAQEEKLSLQQVIQDITQVPVSLLFTVTCPASPYPGLPVLSGAPWGVWTEGLVGMSSLGMFENWNPKLSFCELALPAETGPCSYCRLQFLDSSGIQ